MPDNTAPIRLAVLIASTRTGRFGPTVAEWFAARARARADLKVDVIDLATAWLPEVLAGDDVTEPPAPVRELSGWLDAADAFAVVTPEYNHSFPAALKTAIDWFSDEWQAKPVGYVSYGGISGGLRAVEQLRLVFNEVHAMSVRTSVAFPNYPELFGDDGEPVDAPRYDRYADGMLDELVWWAEGLRRQRAHRPLRVTGGGQ